MSGETVPPWNEIDPICGMKVKPETPHRFEHEGKVWGFCGARCVECFRADPDKYLHGPPQAHRTSHGATPAPHAPRSAARARRGDLHLPDGPRGEQQGPGACPKCGMALEPEMAQAPRTRVEWTCPMHPEIVRDAPGTLPDLRHGARAAHDHARRRGEPRARDMTRRFWVSARS